MKTKLERFMAQTIKAHNLLKLELGDAVGLIPNCDKSLSDAEWYMRNTNYFEKIGVLLTEAYCDKNVNLANSFDKWLALQKHDVKAVNSLYAHKKAVADKLTDAYCELHELENLPEAVRPFAEPTIKRLEQAVVQLCELREALSAAIDAVKATGKAKAVAA